MEHILYEQSNGVAMITLNRPDIRNALIMPLREEMAGVLAEVRSNPAIRALLITGAGPTFSAGGDVKRMAQATLTPAETRALVHKVVGLIVVELLNLEKPVIAAVNGAAIGAGMSLALACDLVLASEEAKFAQAFVRIGAIPDNLAFYLLPRLVGLQKTKELMFTGDTIDALEAERIGLVTRVLPHDRLLPEARALAERLASGPTQAIGLTKALIHKALTVDLAGALELEAMGQAIAFTTADHREGAQAFVEKRPPRFEGR